MATAKDKLAPNKPATIASEDVAVSAAASDGAVAPIAASADAVVAAAASEEAEEPRLEEGAEAN